jgi:hypothetical protein
MLITGTISRWIFNGLYAISQHILGSVPNIRTAQVFLQMS